MVQKEFLLISGVILFTMVSLLWFYVCFVKKRKLYVKLISMSLLVIIENMGCFFLFEGMKSYLINNGYDLNYLTIFFYGWYIWIQYLILAVFLLGVGLWLIDIILTYRHRIVK
jgi:hypothetical protein